MPNTLYHTGPNSPVQNPGSDGCGFFRLPNGLTALPPSHVKDSVLRRARVPCFATAAAHARQTSIGGRMIRSFYPQSKFRRFHVGGGSHGQNNSGYEH